MSMCSSGWFYANSGSWAKTFKTLLGDILVGNIPKSPDESPGPSSPMVTLIQSPSCPWKKQLVNKIVISLVDSWCTKCGDASHSAGYEVTWCKMDLRQDLKVLPTKPFVKKPSGQSFLETSRSNRTNTKWWPCRIILQAFTEGHASQSETLFLHPAWRLST